MKTPEDVEALKLKWAADPWTKDEGGCDLEDTPGFEAFREELRAFRLKKEAEWDQQRLLREERDNVALDALAEKLGVPGNRALARYIRSLETRVAQLEQDVTDLQARG